MSNISVYQSAPMEEIGNWSLAGRGKDTSPECGSWKRNRVDGNIEAYSCIEHKKIIASYQHCYKLLCPTCYEPALNRASERIVNKLHQFKTMSRSKNPTHFSFNIQVGQKIYYRECYLTKKLKQLKFRYKESEPMTKELANDPKKLNEYKKILYKILELCGLEATVLFFHPIRKVCKHCKKRLQKSHEKYEKGKYCECFNYEPYLKFSPHFHALAFGTLNLKSDDFKKVYGFTYRAHVAEIRKNGYKRYRRSFSMKGNKMSEVQSTVRYLLSHTGILEGKNSYSYTGELTSRKINAKRVIDIYEDVLCEECGKKLFKIKNYIEKKKDNPEKLYIESEIWTFDKSRWKQIKKKKIIYEFSKYSRFYIETDIQKYLPKVFLHSGQTTN